MLVTVAVLAVATGVTLAAVRVAPRVGEAPTVAVRLPAATPATPTTPGTPVPARPATGPAAPPAPTARGQKPEYVVYQGQTLSALAARFGTTVPALAALNGITDPDLIFPGQRIRVR